MDTVFTVRQTEQIMAIAKDVAVDIAANMMTDHQITHGHVPDVIDNSKSYQDITDAENAEATDTEGNADAVEAGVPDEEVE